MVFHKNIFSITLTLLFTFASADAHTTGRFHTHSGDHKIYGPDGKRFIPKGVCALSYGWNWGVGDYDLRDSAQVIWTDSGKSVKYPRWQILTDFWKVNTIRLDMFYHHNDVTDPENHYTWQDQLDLIKIFLQRKIVCILTQDDLLAIPDSVSKYYHRIPGNLIDSIINRYNQTIRYFDTLGSLHLNTSYLWFYLNEPRGERFPTDWHKEWIKEHDTLIGGIRTGGHDNIVVCDGNFGGKDHTCEPGYIRRYGRDIIAMETKKYRYSNIVFAFDTYSSMWNRTLDSSRNPGQSLSVYKDYFIDCRRQGLPVIIGEQGYPYPFTNIGAPQYKFGHVHACSDNTIKTLRTIIQDPKSCDIFNGFLAYCAGDGQLGSRDMCGGCTGDSAREKVIGWDIFTYGYKSGEKPAHLSKLGSLLWDYIRMPNSSR